MVEILVAFLIVTSLTAIGGYTYLRYLESVKHSTLVRTVTNVETEVEIEVDHILRGGTSSTPSVDSGEAMTGEITCDEYVRSLAYKYSHLRNPYDGSPMITLWPGWRTFQKRGKVRITCYKVHAGTTVSGSHCPLSKSGIRVDTYYTVAAVPVTQPIAQSTTRIALPLTRRAAQNSRSMKPTNCLVPCYPS